MASPAAQAQAPGLFVLLGECVFSHNAALGGRSPQTASRSRGRGRSGRRAGLSWARVARRPRGPSVLRPSAGSLRWPPGTLWPPFSSGRLLLGGGPASCSQRRGKSWRPNTCAEGTPGRERGDNVGDDGEKPARRGQPRLTQTSSEEGEEGPGRTSLKGTPRPAPSVPPRPPHRL